MTRVLVTGASGFVGQVLCPRLAAAGYVVRAAPRTPRPLGEGVTEQVVVGEIDAGTEWTAALEGVEVVVHLAAKVHVQAADAMDAYFKTNADGTHRLAQQAAAQGIRRLVYLSTVKVNGDESGDQAYSAADVPRPQDAYGASKLRGEQSLAAAAAASGLQSVVVRSPLVYGAGVRANFLRLLEWIDRERLLPLGAIRNRRSLISVWNLSDLLVQTLGNPQAAGGTWMSSDGTDLSTPDLVRRIACLMRRRARLIAVPVPLLRVVGTLSGRTSDMSRLCGSLTVDIAETRSRLGWVPPLSLDEGLKRTVLWYLSKGREASPGA